MNSLTMMLVRHGETAWNRERRYQGWRDVPLSAAGRWEAGQVAGTLADAPVAAVYASPLGRARETAGIVATPHRLPVTADPAFREMSFGAWEGRTVEEVSAEWAELAGTWREAPHHVRFPGGEDLDTARTRVLRGLERLRAAHGGETVVLVSHGVIVRLLVLDALGLDPARLWTVQAATGGITEIEYGAGWVTVHRVNTRAHLEAAREP
jgi:broad specificity phosphatase PhoE